MEAALVLHLVEAQLPHVEVHRLGEAGAIALEQPLVVGVVPALEDHRRAVVALDEQAALVVGREVHRADHPVAAALAQPRRGGLEQRAGDLRVVLALEEAEQPPVVALELVEVAVDVGADPAHELSVPPGQEVLGLGVLEERVLLPVEELPAAPRSAGGPSAARYDRAATAA